MAKTARKKASTRSKAKPAPVAEKPILKTVAKAEPEKIAALSPADFGLVEHKIRRFNALVPAKYANELDNPDLWVHCANKMEMGCEVRCLADDMSFVAYGICTFVQGTIVNLNITSFHELDIVDPDEVGDEASDFRIKNRGPRKWSIIKISTGEVIKEDMATQMEALRELDDYKKVLRR